LAENLVSTFERHFADPAFFVGRKRRSKRRRRRRRRMKRRRKKRKRGGVRGGRGRGEE
jgi:hypothetical protein